MRNSQLHLVDLAGSERVGRSTNTGATLKEGQKINLSLSALGNCIKALCEGKTHTPFRDSKLTKLLAESLGGNTKTSLIVCCSPEKCNYEETLSSLRFAERAKKVKTRARRNQQKSAAAPAVS